MARGRLAGLWAFWRFLKSRDSGVPLKVLAILAVLYVVMPADLVPDVVPFAGWLDDVGVLAAASAFLASAFGKRKSRAASDIDAGDARGGAAR